MNEADAPLDENEPDLPALEFHSPGRFAVHNPDNLSPIDQPVSEPAPFVLGEHTLLERFTNASHAQSHVLAFAQQTRHTLCLYSFDLEPWLFNNKALQQACTHLLLASPRNRLRILLRDVEKPVRQGHRLLNLAKRITSNLQIRKLHPDYPLDDSVYLLSDQSGLLVLEKPELAQGYALYNDPVRVRQRQNLFDQAWDVSLSDPDLRSFLL